MAAGKRELIDTGTDKRYVRRDEKGRFKKSDDVGADSDGSRPGFRDDLARHSDLMSLAVPR